MLKASHQKVTAVATWRKRMEAAKQRLPEGMGQQQVIEAVVEIKPEVDHLTYATRWRNAWFMKVADPEFTELVEQVADKFEMAETA